jgi:FAD/FMN-containing dehydrogenase
MTDPTSMMSPVYQGLTCQVTTDPTKNCTLGAYPFYAVNVSTVAQIQLAINFARNTNLRLVVKNTGHDFSGKSGGAGALSIWTHNLKDIVYIPEYSAEGTDYYGPAFKAATGVQAFEIYQAASLRGLVVVGGEGQVKQCFFLLDECVLLIHSSTRLLV